MQLAVLLSIVLHLVFAVASVWLVAVDLREKRLPNRVVGWASAAMLVLSLALAWVAPAWERISIALVCALAYGAVFLVLLVIMPQAIGAGDVKLAPMIGLVSGLHGVWAAALWTPLLIAVIGGVAGAIALIKRRREIAFGPVMITACWLVVGANAVAPLVIRQ